MYMFIKKINGEKSEIDIRYVMKVFHLKFDRRNFFTH